MTVETDDESADWALHPLTKRTIKALELSADRALNELKGRCSNTTDPLVAVSWGRYSALLEQISEFKHARTRAAEART